MEFDEEFSQKLIGFQVNLHADPKPVTSIHELTSIVVIERRRNKAAVGRKALGRRSRNVSFIDLG